MRAAARHITGTHVYSHVSCPRAVVLDLHGDPARRRAPSEAEAFQLARGREHEARITAELGWPAPEYPRGEFAAGAAATAALLAAGVPGVLQGVLQVGSWLGIPDLLRRVPGASALGGFHYVVGDVKSSARPRADQVLQVAFYSALLTRVQDRAPDHAFLVLKDGHEERIDVAEIEPVLDDVLEQVTGQLDPKVAAAERPFLSRACAGCRWSSLCLPELEVADDLSLVAGMTRGLRQTLERAGVATAARLAEAAVEPLARRTHLEPALLRRLRRAAEARRQGGPVAEATPRRGALASGAIVHLLTDPFAERVLWMGVLHPAAEGGVVRDALPRAREHELARFGELVAGLPAGIPLLHHGGVVPHWYVEATRARHASRELENRFVDLAARLRGAVTLPGPAFGLDDWVRLALGRDPHRAGEAAAAAKWLAEGKEARLRAKGAADLGDLAALRERWLTE
ncbi:MAG: TM0106 family RecB-like putative nuclease [Planctomycetes bacterium]|nr:TM0106 family RecB-like putative nuclease [Planctomycetota bacterium]